MKRYLLALVAGLSAAGTALAAGPYGAAAAHPKLFSSLDRDADGLLNPAEAAADPQLADRWTMVDSNADGAVDLAEFSAFDAARPEIAADSGARTYPYQGPARTAPTPPAPVESRPPATIVIEGRLSDTPTTEGDPAGYLPKAPGPSSSAQRKLEGTDKANYGATTSATEPAATDGYYYYAYPQPEAAPTDRDYRQARFDALDTNRDGAVSYAEASYSPGLLGAWREVDVNADDRLDIVEFSAFERQYGDTGRPSAPVAPMDRDDYRR